MCKYKKKQSYYLFYIVGAEESLQTYFFSILNKRHRQQIPVN